VLQNGIHVRIPSFVIFTGIYKTFHHHYSIHGDKC